MFTKPSTLGNVCRHLQADVGSQGNRTIAPENTPHSLSVTFPLLLWLLYLVCKTADPKPNLKTVERNPRNCHTRITCLFLWLFLKNWVGKDIPWGSLKRLLKMIALNLVLHNVWKKNQDLPLHAPVLVMFHCWKHFATPQTCSSSFLRNDKSFQWKWIKQSQHIDFYRVNLSLPDKDWE